MREENLLHSSVPSTSTQGLLSIDVSHGVVSPPTPPKTPQNQPITSQTRAHCGDYRLQPGKRVFGYI